MKTLASTGWQSPTYQEWRQTPGQALPDPGQPFDDGQQIEEEWLSIKGYEGIYEVSNCGGVRSLDRYVLDKKIFRKQKGVTIKQIDRNGYKMVFLRKGEKRNKGIFVHRLVLCEFIGTPQGERKFVNHKNFKRNDNRLENLEWVTTEENNNYSLMNGRIIRKGIIRNEDSKKYESISSAARDLSVSAGFIRNVLTGINKSCRGFTFSYL